MLSKIFKIGEKNPGKIIKSNQVIISHFNNSTKYQKKERSNIVKIIRGKGKVRILYLIKLVFQLIKLQTYAKVCM